MSKKSKSLKLEFPYLKFVFFVLLRCPMNSIHTFFFKVHVFCNELLVFSCPFLFQLVDLLKYHIAIAFSKFGKLVNQFYGIKYIGLILRYPLFFSSVFMIKFSIRNTDSASFKTGFCGSVFCQ